ncbi:hypothetical protein M8818_005721 [Zalaria obscura]|uniref:Uncharacterized protein n=1 Tax=Zalaria obscura TaxID=2024903 RepID=A0ACC3S8T0_9PEZI
MSIKSKVTTGGAPNAMPNLFSQAIKANGMVFCSGSVGMTPDGKLVEGTIQDRVHQILKNLSAVLEAAGSRLENVVKVNIFLADMHSQVLVYQDDGLFDANVTCGLWRTDRTSLQGGFWQDERSLRSVQLGRDDAVQNRDADVEMECIAMLLSPSTTQILNTPLYRISPFLIFSNASVTPLCVIGNCSTTGLILWNVAKSSICQTSFLQEPTKEISLAISIGTRTCDEYLLTNAKYAHLLQLHRAKSFHQVAQPGRPGVPGISHCCKRMLRLVD